MDKSHQKSLGADTELGNAVLGLLSRDHAGGLRPVSGMPSSAQAGGFSGSSQPAGGFPGSSRPVSGLAGSSSAQPVSGMPGSTTGPILTGPILTGPGRLSRAVLGRQHAVGPRSISPTSPAGGQQPSLAGPQLAWPDFGDEPTQQLPIITPAEPPLPPPWPPMPQKKNPQSEEERWLAQIRTDPPVALPAAAKPAAAGRAVIIYERRSWGLLALTAILVALTSGVVLGQTVADKPQSRSAVAQTAPAAVPDPPSPAPAVAPSDQPLPVSGQRVTAPLGAATGKARTFEITGATTLFSVRSADLGDQLFDVAAYDGSVVPKVTQPDGNPQLEFTRTGAQGRIGGEIQLNSKVKWTLKLSGGAAEQDIDMTAGGLAGIEMAGGASRVVLKLPQPKGTIDLAVSSGVSELQVQAGTGVPVRVRLGKGADATAIDGVTRKKVKADTDLTSNGWTKTTNRYDIDASAKIDVLRIDHL